MCLVCRDLLRQKMTMNEAYRAAREITMSEGSEKHERELYRALRDLDLEKLSKLLEEHEEALKGEQGSKA